MFRRVVWLMVLVVADVLAFALTIRATADYRPSGTGPTVTTLGQVMGWLLSVVLLAAVAGVALSLVRSRRRQGRPGDFEA